MSTAASNSDVTYGGIRLNTDDDAAVRKAKRYRKKMLWRVKWGVLTLLWTIGLVKLYHYDRESIKLYTIFSILVLVYVNLSKDKRKEGELSAYYILNPDCKRLDGEVGLNVFGVKDAKSHPNGGGRSTGTADGGRRLGDGGVSGDGGDDAPPRGGGGGLSAAEVERRRADPDFQADLAQKRGVKRHHMCPCGSGKRFGACCEELQHDLRQRGVHLQR